VQGSWKLWIPKKSNVFKFYLTITVEPKFVKQTECRKLAKKKYTCIAFINTRNTFSYLESECKLKNPKIFFWAYTLYFRIRGKRIRPVLTCTLLVPEQTIKALLCTLAVEVFHNFSLVHWYNMHIYPRAHKTKFKKMQFHLPPLPTNFGRHKTASWRLFWMVLIYHSCATAGFELI
jgi:hypothetical protein